MGSGYQSDPSPSGPSLYHGPLMGMPAPCKAQPAHTNLNIPPKNMISMPPDSPGILFGKRIGPPAIPVGLAPPIPRSDTTTVSTTVMTTACVTLTPHEYNKRYYTMPMRSQLNGGYRSLVCNVTNSTTMTVASHISNSLHGHALTQTSNKGQLTTALSEPTLSIQHSQQSSVTQTESLIAKSTSSSHVASLSSGSHAPGSTSAPQHPSAHTCTSCGCPGHSHMTSYPYLPVASHLLPNPVWHVPTMAPTPTSNGIIPTPHLYPGFAYHIPNIPNGLNPEFLLNHNPNFLPGGALPSLYPHSVVAPAGGGHPVLQRSNSFQERSEKPRRVTCHNCGSGEHVASECTDNSMESISGEFIFEFIVIVSPAKHSRPYRSLCLASMCVCLVVTCHCVSQATHAFL